jgi:formylglycine-generating enzyme required for sulfatase activity
LKLPSAARGSIESTVIDVFISYPRTARAKAESIKVKLETLGLDCYFDLERIDGGANFPDTIDRALRGSKAILCCWSPRYFERPWCMIECRDGLAREIMVPVAVERFERFAPPADLRLINWYNLVDWRGEDAHEDWRRTLLRLGKLVGRELDPPLRKSSLGALSAAGDASAAPESVQTNADLLADLRATWAAFPAKSDVNAVQRFLARVRTAAGSGVEFEVEHHLDELRRGSERRAQETARVEAERRARVAAQVEARRQAEEARARPGAAWRDLIPGLPESACPEMITIPPGKFLMGSLDGREEPQHEVRIDYPFALGNYVVTFAEWDAAIAVGAKLERPADQGWGRHRRPVINVNWEDARAYAAWLNGRLGLNGRADAYRLPSEAEWEYACRAGTLAPYSCGATISTAQANYDGAATIGAATIGAGDQGATRQMTAQAGSFPGNAFGLHDMHGNVWEWCEDVWNSSYSQPGRLDNGTAWLSGDASRRVVRGGSWKSDAAALRSAFRRGLSPLERGSDIGFRLARTVSPANR